MKLYDTLIKVDINVDDENSRVRNGKIYGWCHEKNIVTKKTGDDKHYFVLSNIISNKYVISRSITPPTELGMAISYDTDSYADYIVFSGNNDDEKQIDRLSNKATRFIFNTKTGSFVKKVIVISSGGKRYINLYRTQFFGADINKVNAFSTFGIGGRISYGCGLIMATNVYKHLTNFTKP